jgi:hypothetical protein
MIRLSAAIGLVVLIALLCAYSGFHEPGATLDGCLADPAAHDGAMVYSPHESVIGRVMEGGFTLSWDGREIPVRGTARHLKAGTYVGVRGIFHREGYIEARAIHVGRFRRLKMLASVAGAAIVFVVLGKGFVWDRAQRGFRER